MKVIIYADFNCVFCYLASQRADRLMREGKAQVDWRGQAFAAAPRHRHQGPPTRRGRDNQRCGRPRRGRAARAARRAPAHDAPGRDQQH